MRSFSLWPIISLWFLIVGNNFLYWSLLVQITFYFSSEWSQADSKHREVSFLLEFPSLLEFPFLCWSIMCRRGQELWKEMKGEGDPSTLGDGTAPDGKASWKKRCLSRDLNVKNKLAVARTIKWIQVNVKASISENVGKGERFFFKVWGRWRNLRLSHNYIH